MISSDDSCVSVFVTALGRPNEIDQASSSNGQHLSTGGATDVSFLI